MATNRKALELQRQEKVEYDWGTLWPHYHKEKMNWATGFRTKGDVDILFPFRIDRKGSVRRRAL